MTYNINVQLVDWTFPKIVILATQGADVDVCKIYATCFKMSFIPKPINFDCGIEFKYKIISKLT